MKPARLLLRAGIAAACGIVFLSVQGQLPTPGDTIATAAFGMTVLMGIVVGASTAITGITLVAGGELILLAIDVEKNTRGAEHYAAQTQQAMKSLLQAVTKPRDQVPPPRQSPPPQPARQAAR